MGHHIIWGKVEDTSEDSGIVSFQAKNAEAVRLGVQQYLEDVTFRNDSSGSAEVSTPSRGPCSAGSGAVPPSHVLQSRLPLFEDALASRRQPPKPKEGMSCAAATALDTEILKWPQPNLAETNRQSDDSDDEACKASPTVMKIIEVLEDSDEKVLVEALRQSEGPALPSLDEFWSAGAVSHPNGLCKPCHYIHTGNGCSNGLACDFCHMPHVRRNRPRPCKTKRKQGKRFVSAIASIAMQQPSRFISAIEVVAVNNSQVQALLAKGAGDLSGDRPQRSSRSISSASSAGSATPGTVRSAGSATPGGTVRKLVLSL
eukprot:CAMPEP_0176054664 /NCGR_PEP_ID=MMETSP0120_2-20121206/27201_1 /TAXON_ID=160619 /ORGANISM="Kryptoperidinium foliaceum, Strain CCMP 1326" /LENGTH=314 /DNA_ID=CAMNT_0017388135 /DNA_START=169 /DNA_END=1113 /DNA_ORIENTATION=-